MPGERAGRAHPARPGQRRGEGAAVRDEARVRRGCGPAPPAVLRGVSVGAVPGGGQFPSGHGLCPGQTRPAAGAAARGRGWGPAVTAVAAGTRREAILACLTEHPDLTAYELRRVIGAASHITDLLRAMEAKAQVVSRTERRPGQGRPVHLWRVAPPGTVPPPGIGGRGDRCASPRAGPPRRGRPPGPPALGAPVSFRSNAARRGVPRCRPGPVLPRAGRHRDRSSGRGHMRRVPGPRGLLRAGGAERGALGDLGRRQLRNQPRGTQL